MLVMVSLRTLVALKLIKKYGKYRIGLNCGPGHLAELLICLLILHFYIIRLHKYAARPENNIFIGHVIIFDLEIHDHNKLGHFFMNEILIKITS